MSLLSTGTILNTLYTTEMKDLVASMSLIAKRKDSRWVIIVSTIFFLLLILAIQNGSSSYQLFHFDSLPLYKRITLAFQTFFDIVNTFTPGALILVVLGSFLGGINLSLAYTYMKIRGEVIVKSGLYSGIGLFLAFLGIGCAACGTALLSVLLGFLGFSTMLNVLPYQGQEIGYIGIIILCIATYSLAKKVSAPNVC